MVNGWVWARPNNRGWVPVKNCFESLSFCESLNGVIFSQSTQNTTNMTQTTPLNKEKLFLVISHIIIVLGTKCV
jgi:hypothetical protein